MKKRILSGLLALQLFIAPVALHGMNQQAENNEQSSPDASQDQLAQLLQQSGVLEQLQQSGFIGSDGNLDLVSGAKNALKNAWQGTNLTRALTKGILAAIGTKLVRSGLNYVNPNRPSINNYAATAIREISEHYFDPQPNSSTLKILSTTTIKWLLDEGLTRIFGDGIIKTILLEAIMNLPTIASLAAGTIPSLIGMATGQPGGDLQALQNLIPENIRRQIPPNASPEQIQQILTGRLPGQPGNQQNQQQRNRNSSNLNQQNGTNTNQQTSTSKKKILVSPLANHYRADCKQSYAPGTEIVVGVACSLKPNNISNGPRRRNNTNGQTRNSNQQANHQANQQQAPNGNPLAGQTGAANQNNSPNWLESIIAGATEKITSLFIPEYKPKKKQTA